MELETKNTKAKTNVDLLQDYLAGAKMISKGLPKKEAQEKIEALYKSSKDKDAFIKSDNAWEVASNAEKDLKKASKEFGLRERVNYAVDADVKGQGYSTELLTNTCVATVAMSALMPIAAQDPNRLSLGLLAIGVASTLNYASKTALVSMSASKTEEKKSAAEQYADLKHAQFALKCLKRDLTKPATEVEKLMAQGYGQPSGGLIQGAMLKAGNAR
ncbi:MAG: hypothetical protein MJ247_04720 [Alphaproteobacteria bacterium]|nr:hypothetical protein [Alphaproteobacteria bacterium]